MRSVVVPRGEMLARYGAEVKAFAYAFVITRRGRVGRDGSPGISEKLAPGNAPGKRIGKSIEVKSRLVSPEPFGFI